MRDEGAPTLVCPGCGRPADDNNDVGDECLCGWALIEVDSLLANIADRAQVSFARRGRRDLRTLLMLLTESTGGVARALREELSAQGTPRQVLERAASAAAVCLQIMINVASMNQVNNKT